MALPVALLVTVIGFALATAAVLASVTSQRGTARDSGSKSAIATADGAANVAMLRLNRMNQGLSAAYPCVGVSGGLLTPVPKAENGWCPEVREIAADGSSSAYVVSPKMVGVPMEVVATGSAGGVSRRVSVSLDPTTVGSSIAGEGLIGQEWLALEGNVQNVKVSVGSNGNVYGSGNVEVCGNIRHGIGKEWVPSGNNAKQCNGYEITEGNKTLPEVSTFMPPDIATDNSDARLETCSAPGVPSECQTDGYTVRGQTAPWVTQPPLRTSPPRAPTLTLASNTALTLGGEKPYWLCSLSLSGNSELIMAAGAKVQIFFDTPQNCGLSAGAPQISVTGNSLIKASGYRPTEGDFDMPGLYLLGNGSVNLAGNFTGQNNNLENPTANQMIIYAPRSAISITGNANYKGVIAGNTLKMAGNGYVSQDPGFESPQIGGSTVYSRSSYQECGGGQAVSEPAENC